MTNYAEHARVRPEPAATPAAAAAAPRLSIARRPLLDLSAAAAGARPAASALGATGGNGASKHAAAAESASALDSDIIRLTSGEKAVDSADPDFDLSSTFDVPAFLRRQEG
jgi:hypothetical protein